MNTHVPKTYTHACTHMLTCAARHAVRGGATGGFRNGTNGLPPLNESCAPGALMAGYDLRRANMTVHDAIAWCASNASCAGFTTERAHDHVCPSPSHTDATLDMRFKTQEAKPVGGPTWSHWIKPEAGRVSYEPHEQYMHWLALGDALNKTGRPVWYSICPHAPTTWPIDGTLKKELSYSPPAVWSPEQRHRLANSLLVEYANTWDQWLCDPQRPAETCGHGLDGGIITNIDSMIQLTNLSDSGPTSYWNDADMLVVRSAERCPHSPFPGSSLASSLPRPFPPSHLPSLASLPPTLPRLPPSHPPSPPFLLSPLPPSLRPVRVIERPTDAPQVIK